jgi:hypothetical protein
MAKAMTLADYSVAAFALLNGARVLAYFPQIIRVYRDPCGAAAVSVATWGLFAAANVATVCYALIVANDPVVALVFAMNAVGCLAIVAMTILKRLSRARPASAVIHRTILLQPSRRRRDRPIVSCNRIALLCRAGDSYRGP